MIDMTIRKQNMARRLTGLGGVDFVKFGSLDLESYQEMAHCIYKAVLLT